MTPRTLLIEITPEAFEQLFTRDHAGNRLRVEWGEPDYLGHHTPTISVDYADNLVAAERARILEAVRGLPDRSGLGDADTNRAAVLRIIEDPK